MRPYNSLATLVPLLISLAFAPSVFDTINREAPADEGPKYSVQLMTGAIHPPGVAVPPKSVVMTKKDGKRYRCYLPSEGGAPSAADESLAAPTPHIATYLRALKGTCFYRLEGWWTYEFCLLKAVRQFHQEKVKTASRADATTITQDYTLGEYWVPPKKAAAAAAAAAAKAAITDGEEGEGEAEEPLSDDDFRGEMLEDPKTKRKFWRQFYGNGTTCDLNGKPRESEVRLHCAPGEPSYLASVEEVATCKYLVQFSSNLLCKHPAFAASKKKDAVESVQCEPLDATGAPMPAPKRAPPTPPTTRVAAAEKALGLEGAAAAAAAAAGAGGVAQDRGAARLSARLLSEAAEAAPTRRAYDLGQCLVHHKYSYRGVIVGYHPRCEQSEAWIRQMDVDSLKYGREQPFYHVLPDTRDRPGAQVTYVAQENIMPDFPSEPLQHPMVAEMFGSFDAAAARDVPSDGLRSQYPLPTEEAAAEEAAAEKAAAADDAAAEAAAAKAEVEALEAEAMGHIVDEEEELIVEDEAVAVD